MLASTFPLIIFLAFALYTIPGRSEQILDTISSREDVDKKSAAPSEKVNGGRSSKEGVQEMSVAISRSRTATTSLPTENTKSSHLDNILNYIFPFPKDSPTSTTTLAPIETLSLTLTPYHQTPTNLSTLLHNPHLTNLTVQLTHEMHSLLPSLQSIFSIYTTSPSLQHLSLTIRPTEANYNNWYVSDGPWAFPFITLPSPLILPPLRTLKIIGYDLEESSDGGLAWAYTEEYNKKREEWYYSKFEDELPINSGKEKAPKWFPQPIRPSSYNLTNLQAWIQRADFSQLETLDFELTASTLQILSSEANLHSLKNLVLRYTYPWGKSLEENMDAIIMFLGDMERGLERLEFHFSVPFWELGIALEEGDHSDSLTHIRFPYLSLPTPKFSDEGKVLYEDPDLTHLFERLQVLHNVDLEITREIFGVMTPFPTPETHEQQRSFLTQAMTATKSVREVNLRVKKGEGLMDDWKRRGKKPQGIRWDEVVNQASVEGLWEELRGEGVRVLVVDWVEIEGEPEMERGGWERVWRWRCGWEWGCGDPLLVSWR